MALTADDILGHAALERSVTHATCDACFMPQP